MKRRDFLKSTSIAASTLAFPTLIPRHVLAADGQPGANDRLRVGFIGIGGRARWIISDEGLPGADLVAVADCDFQRVNKAAAELPGGDKWKKYQSYKEMLEKEKLDAVFVETTTHARVLACIQALQAGCDVYGEKPLTLTVAEGRVLANAVKKYNRILQTGSQQRSMPANMHASRLIREGAIGKVHTVITHNFTSGKKWVNPGGEAEAIPEGLDWDAWCNQVELRPYSKELQQGWANYLDYDGGGQSWGVTGWGTHSLDQVQCALGTDDTGPVELIPEEPGSQCRVTLRYENGTLLKLEGPKRGMEDLGAIFIGDKGKIEILRGSYTAEPAELLKDSPPPTAMGPKESLPHIENFFECIRTRAQPNADVETGHRATTLCHLINICRDLQRKLKWDPRAEKFTGDDEANQFLSRPRRKGYELPDIA
ncbi:MAG: Gfo/Idh/MocA family oxidoreductase [Candidatus Omnitrophica bacterium]|nr:MAG: Glucose--fructose oxidoreductase precursor [Candidatus Hinthialibacteria bacterium OLB16]MBE7486944.1 Gfo/Idh/MocA family oxidoreductase [bacterium]MBK7494341.1 Gfo/Idh/MocA family oxidoreductase [Candidatus Omnitrophota bacterium]MCC6732029.1 Gfo/Idh/MocA family oxidoreductase [Candidatus Omnitrophota bacterium]MCK6495913.1 Gfo/Idh/MocA family oxidoreductase [bacterium]